MEALAIKLMIIAGGIVAALILLAIIGAVGVYLWLSLFLSVERARKTRRSTKPPTSRPA